MILPRAYGFSAGPISGVRTGLATPKKTTMVWAGNWVDYASGRISLNHAFLSLKPLPTQTLPAVSFAFRDGIELIQQPEKLGRIVPGVAGDVLRRRQPLVM
jgi:hypothetical protein